VRTKRTLPTLKCPDCSHEFPDSMTLIHLPADLELVAECLELPSTTVTAMLDRGEIPVRRPWFSMGRRAVLLSDAKRAFEQLKTSGVLT